MRHAVPHTAQQIAANIYSQDEHDAAYGIGQFGAEYWPAARKAMPEGSTLLDWRTKCSTDFLASTTRDGHGLLPSMLAGFDAESEDRYMADLIRLGMRDEPTSRAIAAGDTVICVDEEEAEDWLTRGKVYTVQSVDGDVLLMRDDSCVPRSRHHASHFVLYA
jgi:hypothetical protein